MKIQNNIREIRLRWSPVVNLKEAANGVFLDIPGVYLHFVSINGKKIILYVGESGNIKTRQKEYLKQYDKRKIDGTDNTLYDFDWMEENGVAPHVFLNNANILQHIDNNRIIPGDKRPEGIDYIRLAEGMMNRIHVAGVRIEEKQIRHWVETAIIDELKTKYMVGKYNERPNDNLIGKQTEYPTEPLLLKSEISVDEDWFASLSKEIRYTTKY